MQKRKRVTHPVVSGSLTQKHMAESTDINRIMDRVKGGAPLVGPGRPSGVEMHYGTLTGDTYHEMLIKVQRAQGAFAALGPKVRKRFANNVENLLSFLDDPKNLAEAVDLGLVPRDAVSPETLQQMDLARESDKRDREEFAEWQRKKRAGENSDPFERDEANAMPKSDPEANPRNSPKKRT